MHKDTECTTCFEWSIHSTAEVRNYKRRNTGKVKHNAGHPFNWKFYHLLPAAVLMPAPCKRKKITQLWSVHKVCMPSVLTVNAIMCLLSLIHWARSDTLRSSSSGGSKYSLVSSSSRAVLAIVSEHDCAIKIELPQVEKCYQEIAVMICVCTVCLTRVFISPLEPGNGKTQQVTMGWQRWRYMHAGVRTKNSNASPTPLLRSK